MPDQDYVELDPAVMGFTYRGKVAPAGEAILARAFEVLKAGMGKSFDKQVKAGEIFWLNVWQDDDDSENMSLGDDALAADLDALARALAREHAEAGAIVDGYGFIINPVGSKGQVWHIDYTTDAAVVWVPVSRYTAHNATQFVTLPFDTPKGVLHDLAMCVDLVDLDALTRRVPHLRVQQVVAEPMSILFMGRGTIHRGVPNTDAEHRIGFYISVHYIEDHDANYPYPIDNGSERGVVVFMDETMKQQA